MSPITDLPGARFLIGTFAAWTIPSGAFVTAAEHYDIVAIEQPDPGYAEPEPITPGA